ncbi:MAG: Holliday junction branch migration protein RuvA [Propionibacteriaceae bacterium]
MISTLTGTVTAAGATRVILDVQGLGFSVLCTPATAASVRIGERASLFTTLIVREDSLTLYGFTHDAEREAFDVVQSVSGIGPKIAQAVVSVMTPGQLRAAIHTENIIALCAVPGIGKKVAQRLVLELKDKVHGLGSDDTDQPAVAVSDSEPLWRAQVRSGLEGLGWSAKDADAACDRVAPMVEADPELSVAAVMKAALRSLAK